MLPCLVDDDPAATIGPEHHTDTQLVGTGQRSFADPQKLAKSRLWPRSTSCPRVGAVDREPNKDICCVRSDDPQMLDSDAEALMPATGCRKQRSQTLHSSRRC